MWYYLGLIYIFVSYSDKQLRGIDENLQERNEHILPALNSFLQYPWTNVSSTGPSIFTSLELWDLQYVCWDMVIIENAIVIRYVVSIWLKDSNIDQVCIYFVQRYTCIIVHVHVKIKPWYITLITACNILKEMVLLGLDLCTETKQTMHHLASKGCLQ